MSKTVNLEFRKQMQEINNQKKKAELGREYFFTSDEARKEELEKELSPTEAQRNEFFKGGNK